MIQNIQTLFANALCIFASTIPLDRMSRVDRQLSELSRVWTPHRILGRWTVLSCSEDPPSTCRILETVDAGCNFQLNFLPTYQGCFTNILHATFNEPNDWAQWLSPIIEPIRRWVSLSLWYTTPTQLCWRQREAGPLIRLPSISSTRLGVKAEWENQNSDIHDYSMLDVASKLPAIPDGTEQQVTFSILLSAGHWLLLLCC